MKLNLILLAIVALPMMLVSCVDGTEYHSVRVYEHHHARQAPPSDDPRAFVPKEKF